jgi:hypothetical protein
MEHCFDAIILAKGAPVQCSDGTIVMCAIALSEQFGLVRLYPLSVSADSDIRVWSIVSVKARRSQKDNRKESWRVMKCLQSGAVTCRDEKNSILNACVLKSGTQDPIAYQNATRASICIVKSTSAVGFSMMPRSESDFCNHDPEETWVMTQSNYPFKPYIYWTSVQGVEHKTHVVAQEVYVGMHKNASCPARIFENMHLGDRDYEHWIVLGNCKDRRNVWVAPHIHRLKKTLLTTRLNFPIFDGKSDAWPYLTQEDVNAKDAGQQMTFAFITDATQ